MGRPEVTVETSRNWWYHTGDIGRIDEDGYLYFVDRKADYLSRRGKNISGFEVERTLMGHGALADVAVHAVRSDDRGRPQDHRHGKRTAPSLTEESVPVVYRSAPVLRTPSVHRVPAGIPPYPFSAS